MNTNPSQETNIIRPLKRIKRKWVYASVGVIVVLGAGVTAAAVYGTQKSGGISASLVYTVGYGTVTQLASASGTIEPETSVNLNFGSVGTIKSLNVKIGQHVKAGQLLATVDETAAKVGVAQAKAAVASAEAKLTQDKEGATQTALAVAQLNVTKAQVSLTTAKQQYQDQLAIFNDRTTAQQQVTNAQTALDQAKSALQTAEQTKQGNLTLDQQQLTAAQQNEQTAADNLQTAQQEYGSITQSQVKAAYLKYQSELSFYHSWENSGYTGQNPYQSVLSSATSYYQALDSGYSALQQAQQANQSAQQALTQAQIKLQTDESSVSSAESQYQTAQQNLQSAQAQYSDRTQAQQALDNSKNNVSQAELALQSAQLSLQQAQQPADAAVLQQDEASILSAQAQLQSAQAILDETMIKAPFSGLVTQVNGVAGEQSSTSTPVVVLMNDNKASMELSMQVSESDIGPIKAGNPVSFTVPSLPGITFAGKVLQVYPTPQVVSNVTEYTVMASVDNSAGKLLSGMSASCTIQTATASHVITVPATAIAQMGNIEGVYVVGSRPSGGNGFSHFGKNGSASGGQGKQGSGTRSGTSGQGSNNGSQASGSGFGQARQSASGGGGAAGSASGTYFEPVQVGLFGTRDVEIKQGLTVGEKILLVPSGQSSGSSQSGARGGGFGGIRRGGL